MFTLPAVIIQIVHLLSDVAILVLFVSFIILDVQNTFGADSEED
jgi:hypothetical protein